MTEPPTADAPIDVPEADLLEQRTAWQENPEDAVSGAAGPVIAVSDSSADEGDLLEQAQAVVSAPDDDEHPYGAPA